MKRALVNAFMCEVCRDPVHDFSSLVFTSTSQDTLVVWRFKPILSVGCDYIGKNVTVYG